LHHSAPPRTRASGPSPADKLERHLEAARPFLADGDETLLREIAKRHAALPPCVLVPTHGDLQLRNAFLSETGSVAVFDFERVVSA